MRRLLLLILCIFSAFPVTGQGDEAPSASAVIAYPSALIVRAEIPVAETRIRSVDLFLRTRDGVEERLILEPDDVIVQDEQASQAVDDALTRLETVYVFSRETLPILFEPIVYVWEVVLDDGTTLSIEGSVEFTDQRILWRLIDDPHGGLRIWVPAGVADADPLAAPLRLVYRALSTAAKSAPPVTWILYPGLESPFCEQDGDDSIARTPDGSIMVECNPALAEAMFRASGILPLRVTEGDPALGDMLFDQLFRTFWEDRWSESDIPQWFTTALRRYFEIAPDVGLYAPALTAARINRLFSLDAMTSPQDQALSPLYTAQAYGMLMYILDQVGQEGLYRLARTAGEYETFADAYQAVVGEPLTRLIPNWERWLFTNTPAAVYAISPYTPLTAAPAPTLTQPPSRTPSPSPSATAVPSDTATLTPTLNTPTAIPTVTPSRTPSPRPPTVTPRPPGSLDPTPVPVQASGANGGVSFEAAVVIAGALIVIALAAVALLQAGKKR